MKKLFTFAFLVGSLHAAYATHFLGGEIRTKRLSTFGLTYEISVFLYFDESSGSSAADAQNGITVCVGEANQTITFKRAARIKVSAEVSLNTYYGNFTYAAPGTYTVAVPIESPNPSLANFNSVNTPFYLQTTFATHIINSTPVFNSPVGTQYAGIRQVFNDNINAVDAEGDSLVYRLGVSKQGQPGNCRGKDIPDYRYPNEVTREGVFEVNSATGDLTWNAPTQAGTYAYTIIVEEWRAGVRISETHRGVTLKVADQGGTPVIIPPFEYPGGSGIITGISAEQSELLKLFPSPAQHTVRVSYRSGQPIRILFQLLDIKGKILNEHREMESYLVHDHEFEVNHLPQGVYFVRTVGDKISTKKFIKE